MIFRLVAIIFFCRESHCLVSILDPPKKRLCQNFVFLHVCSRGLRTKVTVSLLDVILGLLLPLHHNHRTKHISDHLPPEHNLHRHLTYAEHDSMKAFILISFDF